MKKLPLIVFAMLAAAIPMTAWAQAAADEEETELNVTAERMEVQIDGKTIELTNNVRFEDDSMVLTADRMLIFLEDEPKGEKKDEKKEEAKEAKEEQKEEMHQLFLQFRQLVKDYPWFEADARVLLEEDIITPSGDTYRPDRVVIRGKEAIVIDYKFGEIKKRSYHYQVANYMALLRQMGYQTKGYLVYVSLLQIDEVK